MTISQCCRARNVKMTKGLIEQLKNTPKAQGDAHWLEANLANRIAVSQVVDRALLARKLLATGRQEPNVQALEPARKAVQARWKD